MSIPRALAIPIPTQQRYTMSVVYDEPLTIAAGAVSVSNSWFEAHVPAIAVGARNDQANWRFPYGFLPMMQIYGRCIVEKVRFTYRLEPKTQGNASIGEIVYGFLPLSRIGNLPNDAASFNCLASLPFAKKRAFGSAAGSNASVTVQDTVDLQVFTGQPLVTQTSGVTRDLLPAGLTYNSSLTYPEPAVSTTQPVFFICLYRSSNDSAFDAQSSIKADFQVRFMDPVQLPQQIDVQNGVTWTWAAGVPA